MLILDYILICTCP